MANLDWTLVYDKHGIRAWVKGSWRVEQYSPTGHFKLLMGHRPVADKLPGLAAANREIERRG